MLNSRKQKQKSTLNFSTSFYTFGICLYIKHFGWVLIVCIFSCRKQKNKTRAKAQRMLEYIQIFDQLNTKAQYNVLDATRLCKRPNPEMANKILGSNVPIWTHYVQMWSWAPIFMTSLSVHGYLRVFLEKFYIPDKIFLIYKNKVLKPSRREKVQNVQ